MSYLDNAATRSSSGAQEKASVEWIVPTGEEEPEGDQDGSETAG